MVLNPITTWMGMPGLSCFLCPHKAEQTTEVDGQGLHYGSISLCPQWFSVEFKTVIRISAGLTIAPEEDPPAYVVTFQRTLLLVREAERT